MRISQVSGYAAAGCPIQKADLDQEWLVDLFEDINLFSEGGSQRGTAHRTAIVLFDNCPEQAAIHFVESVRVHLQHCQGGLRRGAVYDALRPHLREGPD